MLHVVLFGAATGPTDDAFAAWQRRHDIAYATADEAVFRRAIWERNALTVHQRNNAGRDFSFNLGLNALAADTEQELAMRKGLKLMAKPQAEQPEAVAIIPPPERSIGVQLAL
jgi:hypothetical protein|eukprot:1544149-Prymnesium_polylepis.1